MPAEKGPFLVCRKTGKIVGFNRERWWVRWLFLITGLAALIWFLVRVLPKPSRASYPCQRVGAPVALGGIVYVLSLCGLVSAFRHARQFIRQHRFAVAGACVVAGLACALVVVQRNESAARAEKTGSFVPSDAPNQPIAVNNNQ